jgi:hypothetical protein
MQSVTFAAVKGGGTMIMMSILRIEARTSDHVDMKQER